MTPGHHPTIPAAGAREALLWLLRRRRRFAVRGRSMLPALYDGATVLAEPGIRPAVGDVVVARHPYERDRLLVKRVAGLEPDGRAALVGDNPQESTHSFGALPPEAVLGVVRSRLTG
jgi:phage repressor protein C with HTH and peptisase S24 domain